MSLKASHRHEGIKSTGKEDRKASRRGDTHEDREPAWFYPLAQNVADYWMR
jgi:hypothetical protein